MSAEGLVVPNNVSSYVDVSGNATDTPERWLVLSVATDDQWSALVDALGRPGWATDPALRTHAGRRAAHDLLDEKVGAWAAETDLDIAEHARPRQQPRLLKHHADVFRACLFAERNGPRGDALETGDQPIQNENGTVWAALNGEIYNFQSLRSRLQSLGHRFRTRSDTEVLAHAYEEYGIDCVPHLDGMFAFAIWDAEQRMLLLARDRMGEKPLYYYSGPDAFVFGSELRALLAHPAVPRELSFEDLRKRLEGQTQRKGRLDPPAEPGKAPPTKIVWTQVSAGYQPVMVKVWFDCMQTYYSESKIDRVFSNSVFWVITRSNECFY